MAVTLLNFQSTVTGETAVVTLTGELDVAGAGLLQNELERIVTDHEPTALVLDLSQLAFMDSTGLRLMVLTADRSQQHGVALSLVRGPEDVHRVFEITRMTDRLNFVDSVAEVTDAP